MQYDWNQNWRNLCILDDENIIECIFLHEETSDGINSYLRKTTKIIDFWILVHRSFDNWILSFIEFIKSSIWDWNKEAFLLNFVLSNCVSFKLFCTTCLKRRIFFDFSSIWLFFSVIERFRDAISDLNWKQWSFTTDSKWSRT